MGRDARIPLSSRNPNFAPLISQKPSIVVYNKKELANLDRDAKKTIREWSSPSVVTFQSARLSHSVSNLLSTIKRQVKEQTEALSVQGVRILILGMPNVGKSTLLNTLRHLSLSSKKAAKTGAQPGITRSTNSIFKIFDDPTVYIVDTPGIMIPFVPDTSTMLKLGLVHSIKESVLDPITIADYLLFVLNKRDHRLYSMFYGCEPTNDIHILLEIVGKQNGKLKKGGIVDLGSAAKMFVQRYRDGLLGCFCLDSIFPDALKERIEEEGKYLSKSQVRRGATVRDAQQT